MKRIAHVLCIECRYCIYRIQSSWNKNVIYIFSYMMTPPTAVWWYLFWGGNIDVINANNTNGSNKVLIQAHSLVNRFLKKANIAKYFDKQTKIETNLIFILTFLSFLKLPIIFTPGLKFKINNIMHCIFSFTNK